MKEKLILLLVGRAGTILAALISGVAAYFAAIIAERMPMLSGVVTEKELFGILWALAMLGINEVSNRWLKEYVVPLQAWMNSKGIDMPVEGIFRGKSLEGVAAVVEEKIPLPEKKPGVISKIASLLLLVLLAMCLAACPAFQPFLRVDREGYQAGVKGDWESVWTEVRRATRAEADGKEFVP